MFCTKMKSFHSHSLIFEILGSLPTTLVSYSCSPSSLYSQVYPSISVHGHQSLHQVRLQGVQPVPGPGHVGLNTCYDCQVEVLHYVINILLYINIKILGMVEEVGS